MNKERETHEAIEEPRHNYMDGIDDMSTAERVAMFNAKFNIAYSAYSTDRFNKQELLYLGDASVDKDRNSTSNKKSKKSVNVRNINYELVESQVDTTVYQPSVKSKKKGFAPIAKMAQEKIAADLATLGMEQINDLQERNTYIHGVSATLVDWDNSIQGMDYNGEKDIRLFHAKQIIPQPNIYELEKMNYFFIAGSTTKKSIMDRYGVDVLAEGEAHPEFNQLTSDDESMSSTNSDNPENELVTEVICFYKDDDGDLGKIVFTTNEEPLADTPKYYYPRENKCTKCGETFSQRVSVCPKCGCEDVKTNIIEFEEAEEDIELEPLSYNEIKKVVKTREVPDKDDDGVVKIDEMGNPVAKEERYIEEVMEEVILERKIKKGDKIPVFVPKCFPLVVRRNVTKNFDFAGVSDIDIISDQANEIKKAMHKASKKVNQATTLVFLPEQLKGKQLSTEEYQLWYADLKTMNGVRVEEIKSDATQNLNYVEVQVQAAKDTLGITSSFQGQADTTANSGRAKLAQIQQAEGRLASKRENKRTYFKNLFRVMFYFDLAFTDEPRDYLTKNNRNEDQFGTWDKKEFLMLNKADEWEYVTDFKFDADLDDSLPSDKQSLYELTLQQLQLGALDKESYWEMLETLNYPRAGRELEKIREMNRLQEEQARQQGMQDGMMGGGETQQTLQSLPPEIAQQAMADPAVLAQVQGGM